MGKASEIWKEIKPKVGEMLMAVNDIETQAEKAQEEAYQRGMETAWAAARKIVTMPDRGFITSDILDLDPGESIFTKYTASEAIEKIRQYEQEKEKSEEQKKQESITAEDVMRQYLDNFCRGRNCTKCPLHT